MNSVLIGECEDMTTNEIVKVGYVCKETWDRINRIQNGLEKYPSGDLVFLSDFKVLVGQKYISDNEEEALYARRVVLNHVTETLPKGCSKFFKLL